MCQERGSTLVLTSGGSARRREWRHRSLSGSGRDKHGFQYRKPCFEISGCGIETFYLVSKNINLESSTIRLVGVDMIENANSILIIETYFYI